MTADLRQRLEQSLGNSFTLTRELGGGGMSRVFLATDTTLQRDVVVKVLSDEFTGGVSADRFRREIQVIAKLQHPHVVPLLTAGSADGALYYIMPYRGGETLRARMARDGRLEIAEAVRILRTVLDALAFAHAHGVIHRDIKPENILIEAGHAVVADFGVSKALRDSSSLTSVGVALGTPIYMAPEQAAADPDTDHRADLYAVGIVAYEMLAGAPPFTGSPQQVFRAHLMEEPAPLRERRADVPETLANLVMQTLRKEPARRPMSAADMLAQLEGVETPRRGTSAFEIAQRKNPLRWIGVGATIVLLAAAGTWRLTRPQVIPSAQSLAITPFAVGSADSALVRLGQNLVSTVSASVDGVGQIRVADPMAVLSNARSKGNLLSAADAAAIARKLGARSVLHGTLVSLGAAVRADAVLQETSSGNVIARFSVTAPADSVTAISDSLTWGVLRAVWGRGEPPTPNVASITTRSPASLREFLEGERQSARGDMAAAWEAYERAIRIDSTFWFAHMRYILARQWWLVSPDTAIAERLERNRHRLPARDREWIMVCDGAMGLSARLGRRREFLARHPAYLPARVSLADNLLHDAGRAGHDMRESVPMWREIVALVPGDQEMAGHFVWACMVAGDMASAREGFARLDSLVRSDSAPSLVIRSFHQLFGLTLAENPRRYVDSIARVASAGDSLPPHFASWSLAWLGPMSHAVPDLSQRWEMAMRSFRVSLERLNNPAAYRYAMKMGQVARGDWTAIDSAIAYRAGARFHVLTPVSEHEPWRAQVIGEALGLVEPSVRTAQWALARGNAADASAALRQEGRWSAAVNAALRGDSVAYSAQLRALVADTGAHARIAARSLRALALGRSGDRAAGAESLLVVEREHGEYAPKLYSAFAVNRMVGAQWLLESGKPAAADSLLRFTQQLALAGAAEAATPVFALAMLQRSRIAEALGNSADAVAFASAFVNTWDLAPASQQPLKDEAKQRILRLSGVEARR